MTNETITLADKVWSRTGGWGTPKEASERVDSAGVTIYWCKHGYIGENGWEVCTYAGEDVEDDGAYFAIGYFLHEGEWKIPTDYTIHKLLPLCRPPILEKQPDIGGVLNWMQKNQDQALAQQAEEE